MSRAAQVSCCAREAPTTTTEKYCSSNESADAIAAERRPRTLSTSPAAAANEASNAANKSRKLLFVTANNPKGFKGKGVMRQVRKQAMNNYLEQNSNNSTKLPVTKTDGGSRKSSKSSDVQRMRQKSDDSAITESSIIVLEEPGENLMSKDDVMRLVKGKKRGSNSSTATRETISTTVAEDGTSAQLVRTNSVISLSETSFSPLDTISIMHPPPILTPVRPGKRDFDVFEIVPFKSIGRPLDPFRAMHQASHARVSVEELKFHCKLLSLFLSTS